MAITKLKDGRYRLSFRPYGVNGKYLRRVFNTRSEALRFERDYLLGHSKNDDYYLLDVVNLWFDYFGCNLKEGKKRLSKLIFLVNGLGNIHISKLKPEHYLDFRKKRLDSGISANTCNHDLAYFKTVFNKLNKMDLISVNPFANIPLLSFDSPELSYLTRYQLKRLLVACRQSMNESLLPVVLLCIRTGCRWSEAEKLKHHHLSNESVTFTKTKNGKNRTVPLQADFYHYLKK